MKTKIAIIIVLITTLLVVIKCDLPDVCYKWPGVKFEQDYHPGIPPNRNGTMKFFKTISC